jgi:preprotein translocase subunit YajC
VSLIHFFVFFACLSEEEKDGTSSCVYLSSFLVVFGVLVMKRSKRSMKEYLGYLLRIREGKREE